MHACGHDGHTATLARHGGGPQGDRRSDLPVCVKLMWQPAEEGGGGAERLVKAGVLDGRIGPKVAARLRPARLAGAEGRHGRDQARARCSPRPTRSSRRSSAGVPRRLPPPGHRPDRDGVRGRDEPPAVRLPRGGPGRAGRRHGRPIHAGTATNIIPDTCDDRGHRPHADRRPPASKIRQSIERRCRGIARQRLRAAVRLVGRLPADDQRPGHDRLRRAGRRRTLGPDRYFPVPRPSMGGEDFAYYLEKVPGCFFLVGVEPPDATATRRSTATATTSPTPRWGGGADVRGAGEALPVR